MPLINGTPPGVPGPVGPSGEPGMPLPEPPVPLGTEGIGKVTSGTDVSNPYATDPLGAVIVFVPAADAVVPAA